MKAIKDYFNKFPIRSCITIFTLCFLLQISECIFLRLDETIIAENFINKICGIIILVLLLKILNIRSKNIGLLKTDISKRILQGLLMGFVFFIPAYAIELIILNSKGSAKLSFFVSGFSLTGEIVKNVGLGYILMNIVFNIINVIMEEGVFRGLFITVINKKYSFKIALIVSAFLFGLWHLSTPIRSFIDGELGLGMFMLLGFGYIILAGLMGIKWGLLYKMTGSLYLGMADHFFNNCIATNLLHVITKSSVDELLIVRVLIAQMLSLMFVLILYNKKKKMETKND